MNDYIEVDIKLIPFDPWADVISQNLTEIGFDSFSKEAELLKAYIKSELFEKAKIEVVLSRYKEVVSSSFTFNRIPAKNWNAEWEANFQPVQISGKIYIRAPFHDKKPEYEIEILLTPKMSFGTGHHATTGMMMQEMLQVDLFGSRILDVGCGTAILSILSEKLHSAHILAIDNDDWAVTNSGENIEINNCEKITVEKAEVSAVKRESFNVILANINRNVIVNDMATYADLMSEKSHLLISGFHLEDSGQLEILATELNFQKVNMLNEGEWCMLHFVKGNYLEKEV